MLPAEAEMDLEKHQIYQLGEYLLDPARRRLNRNGEPIHLSKRPFQVLIYLIRHRDRLITRDELLERFWDGREVYDDSVRKAVSTIRKALDDRRDPPRFIETRYGEGYRYVGPLAEQWSTAGPAAVEVERVRGVKIVVEEEIHEAPDDREGGKPDDEPASKALRLAGQKARRAPLAVSLAVALTAIALGVAAFAFYRSRANPNEIAPAPPRSIAVLPLKNLSGDPEQDYFSDGVTESLITELARIRDLKVIARNSTFAFKGKEVDVREIGQRLGVAAVLEGSVRRQGETVRVTIRLVSAEDRRVLWTGDATRPLKDIIAVQDEIGCSVAESLRVVLCRDPNHKPGTNNLAAYDAYLKARARRLNGDPKQAAELYQQAVDADQNYALGWAGLAEAYTVMEVNSMVPPRSMTPKAKECAFKAMVLDGALAAPHAALGLLAAFSDRDWATGERYFKQALAINPNYAIGHAWYANTLLAQGKYAEAEAEYLRARELDPLNAGFANNLAETYYYWRQPERCLAQAAQALEMEPGNQWARVNQAKCYSQQGRHDEALQVPLASPFDKQLRLIVLAQSGRLAEARELLPLVIQDNHRTSPYIVAVAHAVLGENEAAFAWLRKAADGQQANLVSLKIDPDFDGLRNDPRFAELLRRVGLTP
jgi:TolB-like protein/DNA-binding winged helix-turn-helix (wHTH) protein